LKKQMTEAAGPASGPASIATPGTKLISIAQIASDGGARQKGADPELVESIRINGLMQPIVVTDDGTGYRIIAGRRRLAALREVGVDAAPCVIVSATTPEDRKALELVENLHRLGLTAMQEAQGFQELAKRGLDAAAIGARVGRSVAYVYDRLRFTKLVPAAVRLLEDGRIEAGHAVILARLRPADQLRAISTKAVDAGYDDRHSPLWRMERTLFDHPGKMTRACSVRELDDWVRKHVRFNPEKDVDPVLLPGTAEILAMATKPREGQKKPPKVILITELQHLPDDARGDERVLCVSSWVEAKKPCGQKDRRAVGVFAVGARRGQAIDVCIDKQTCRTHWGKVIRQRQQSQKAQVAGPASKEQEKYRRQMERQEKERNAANARREAWEKSLPAIRAALVAAVIAAPIGKLSRWISGDSKPLTPELPHSDNPATAVRFVTLANLVDQASQWNACEHLPAEVKKLLDVDLTALVPKPASEPKAQKPAAKS